LKKINWGLYALAYLGVMGLVTLMVGDPERNDIINFIMSIPFWIMLILWIGNLFIGNKKKEQFK